MSFRSSINRQFRGISFFNPTGSYRVSSYSRPTQQALPTYEEFASNYEYLSSDEFKSPKVNENNNINKNEILNYEFTGEDLISIALDSVKLSVIKPNFCPKISNKLTDLEKFRNKILDSNTNSLYKFIKLNRNKLSGLIPNLTKYEVSLLVKKLANFQLEILNQFLKQQINYNNNKTSVVEKKSFKKLLEIKNEVYKSISIFLNIIKTNYSLTIFDYENLICFHYKNLHYYKALLAIHELETLKNLELTNLIWSTKILILSNSTNFFSLFNYKQNNSNHLNNPKSFEKLNYTSRNTNISALINEYRNSALTPDLNINIALIRAATNEGDIKFLDEFLSHNWGVKTNLDINKDQKLVKSFNIDELDEINWPNENLLKTILIAYTKLGKLSKGLNICNTMLENYGNKNNLHIEKTQNYWELALKCAAIYGKACEENILNKLKKKGIDFENESGNEYENDNEEIIEKEESKKMNHVLKLRYYLFDKVWDCAENCVDYPSREMINLKIKFSSVDELLKNLPKVYLRSVDPIFSKLPKDSILNDLSVSRYVNDCVQELTKRGKFPESEILIERFSPNDRTKNSQLLKLKEIQEKYMLQKLEKVNKTKKIDDDDDFDLW